MAPIKRRAVVQAGIRKRKRKQHIARMVAARQRVRAVEESRATPSVTAETPSVQPVTAPLQLSASRRKLEYFSSASPLQQSDLRLPMTVADLSTIAPLFEGLSCKSCNLPELSLVQGRGSKALAIHLQLLCRHCGTINSETQTLPKSTSQAFDVNRRSIATGLTTGMGYSSLSHFSEGLGMPTMHLKSYQCHVSDIYTKTRDVAKDFLQQAREKVAAYYRENDPQALQADGSLSIVVSFDGTWPKRGHTSKLGCGMVIEVMTGLVVDFHVMSLHCQLCSTTGRMLQDRNKTLYDEWMKDHTAKGTCTRNYVGSSGGMEVEAALTMWRRSEQHGMRYTTLVGDGDTKTFLSLTKEQPYGKYIAIRKEECVNHVSKRLNTALRTLKTTAAKKAIRLGGNTKGSLTNAKIGLLQSYYTKAVRMYNQSVESMTKAIWAAFYHSVSTDLEPQHDNCPSGSDSWCWFQRDLAAGIRSPSSGDRQLFTYLNPKAAEHVKAVYTQLTSPDLLSRCLLGKTQNANESLHSIVWSRCLKHLWNGYKRVYIATVLGIGEFNMGSSASQQFLLLSVGCPVTQISQELGLRHDRKRVAKADAAQESTAKRQRQVRRLAEQRQLEAAEVAEGGPSYISGGF